MAVLFRIEADGAVDPHGPVAVMLKQQLVEVDVLQDKLVVLLAHFQTGQVDVHRLACEVLRIAHAVDALVNLRTTEAAVDLYRSEHTAQRLTQCPTEVDQPCQLQLVGRIVHLMFFRSRGTCHLFVAEMRTQHKILSLAHTFYIFTFLHSSTR